MKTAFQIPLDLTSRPAMGRDDFLISPANRDAVAWIDRWPDWRFPVLVLSGPASCGKSHLAAVWCERTRAEFIRPDMLMSRSAEQIASAGTALVFDGLDPWIGDETAETTLFHLFNIFREEQRTFLVTMRMTPSQADFVIPDLASRFRAAPAALVHEPDDDLLGAILIKLFHDRQLAVSEDVIRYILPRMERSFAAAHDIVAAADHLALSQKRAVSVPLMRDILGQMQDNLF